MLERSIVWVGKSLTVLSLMLVFGLTAAENYRMQELPFIPEMGGVFRVGTAHWFYVGRGKNLQIFDNSLNPRQLVFLSIDTAAIDFADIDSDGAEDLIELAQLQVNVRRFRNGVFSQPETIIRERLVFPIYVDNLEQSALCADFDRDGFTDFFLPAEGKFFAYRNENGVKFTRIAILPYQPRGSFTNRLWQNSDLMSNAIRSTVIIPQPFFIDFNRDGVLDAAARVDEKVYYFLSRTTDGAVKPFV
ncbi:MAG: VCBS repeat-containing protein, partial [Leptospiraceae bacterium]|nr:VCBS repeat-containing protein [Leptospiraceae bacterium]